MAFTDALREVTGALGMAFAPEQAMQMRQLQEQKRQAAIAQIDSGVQNGAIDPNQGNMMLQRLGAMPTGQNALTQQRIETAQQKQQDYQTLQTMLPQIASSIDAKKDWTPEQKSAAKASLQSARTPNDARMIAQQIYAPPSAPTQIVVGSDNVPRVVDKKAGTSKPLDFTVAPKGTGAAQLSLSNDPETLRAMAEQAWKGDTSVFTNLGRGAQGANNIITLRKEMQQIGKEQGLSNEEIGSHLAGLNAQYKSYQAQVRTEGTRAGQITIAANEANKMAPIVIQNMQALGPSSFVPYNVAANAYAKHTGDPKIQAYGAAINAFINSYSRAINPTGTATISDKEHARELLSAADSPEQVVAVMKTLQQEMQAALNAPPEARKQMMEEITKTRAEKAKESSGGGWSAKIVK